MSFYLGKTKLPILEPNVTVSKERESVNVPILNGETITIMGKKGLTEIDYSSFFPSAWGTYCDVSASQLKSPNKYKKIIEELRDNENYFLVRITELKLNLYCKIKSATFSPENGVGDIAYTIQLEEYNRLDKSQTIYIPPVVETPIIEQSQQVVAMTNTDLTGKPRESKTVKSQYYKITSTDTPNTIARKFNMNWKDIYDDNRSIIGSNPGLLIVGTPLFIRGTDTDKTKKILRLGGRNVVVNHS